MEIEISGSNVSFCFICLVISSILCFFDATISDELKIFIELCVSDFVFCVSVHSLLAAV